MSKHKLKMKITGPGLEINLYCINKAVLKDFKANAKSNSPKKYHEILNQNGIDGELICWGIDVIDGPRKISIDIDGKTFEIDEVRNVDDADETVPDDTIANVLYYSDESVNELNGEISSNQYALVVVDRYSLATLYADFEANDPIDIKKLRLELKDLDTSSDFSAATWQLDLADDLEKDAQSISYDGFTYEFDFQCSDFDTQEVYLVERNSQGDLQISEDSDYLF